MGSVLLIMVALAQYDLSVLEDAERASAERLRMEAGVFRTVQPPALSTPRHACGLALRDAAQLDKQALPFTRYIWIPDGRQETAGAVIYALNAALSHATTAYRPTIVAEGYLVRLDLRTLCPRDADLDRVTGLWEQLADIDPYFHFQAKIPCKPYRAIDGKIYDYKGWKTEFALHVQPNAGFLSELTGSRLPVARADWFIVKALSTENGGFYYKFRDVPATQEEWLKRAGSSEALVAQLRSDERVAIFRSGVTGKPRRIDLFFGLGTRPSAGAGLISITRDVADGDLTADRDPLRNLLEFNDAAREAFRTLPNGYREAVLFDGQGNRQDAAPPEIAADRTVPAPHSTIVQPIISCLRCHGPHDMYQPFDNDVQKLLEGGVDVFDDLSSREGLRDTLDRLAGLYSGDLTDTVQRGRDDHAKAVFLSTRMRVSDVTGEVGRLYEYHEYNLVTPEVACRELGLAAEGDRHARAVLRQRIRLLPKNEFGFSPEDPIIGALLAGLGVNRRQFEKVYPDLATRLYAGQLEEVGKP